MAKFATRFPDETRLHAFNGELRVLGKRNDYNYDVEIALLDDRVDANNWQFINLEKHRPLFAKKPILIAYTQGGRKIGDGHNMRETRGRDGKKRYTFTDADSERIIGSLSDDDRDIRIERRDGHTWIVGTGTIWAWYAAEAVEKIASQGRMSVSIETIVTEFHMEGDTEVEDAYVILGATILGDDVQPAVRGAHIRPLSEAEEAKFTELKLRAASYNGSEPKNAGKPADNTDKGVKPRMNNKKLREQMQALFPNDRVLAVSEDAKVVYLSANTDGEVRGYTFSDEAPEMVLENRFLSAQATVNLVLASGIETSISLDEYFEPLQRQLSIASDELTKEKKLREEAETALKVMRENEKKRRCAAVKSAARAELARFNEALAEEDRMSEKVCEDIDKDADEGMYENAVDKDGQWCGEQKACAAMKALCADTAHDVLARMNQKKQKPVYAWSNAQGGNPGDGADDPVKGLLCAMGVDPELK